MSDSELNDLKYTNAESYFMQEYGSLHGGFIAWQDLHKSFKQNPDINIDVTYDVNGFFEFLDVIINAQEMR